MSIFNYLNYREFLKAFYSLKKAQSPSYSYAVFSQRSGIKSPNYLKLVMEGTRNITSDNLLAFAKGLGLSELETLYWENLVSFNQAKSPDQRRYYLMRLTRSPLPPRGAQGALIREIRDEWDYFSSWHHAAIRELVLLSDFKPEPSAIAALLCGRITAEEAQESLALLKRLGFLVEDNGKLVQAQAQVRYFSNEDLSNLMIRRFHRSTAELAVQVLDDESEHSYPQRDYSGLVIAVNPSSLPKIKAKIAAFRKELNQEFSLPPQPTSGEQSAGQVFHLNLQLIPLTLRKL